VATGISLHIGLNSVDTTHYRGWDGKLRGCEQDAHDMQHVADGLGYSSTLLLTKDATVANVTGAIEAAAKALGPGDTFFVTYSGHGGQVPDTNGDERTAATDEVGAFPDRYDETWVLYDRMLIDDELFALWSQFVPKARIIMLSDSCHSGTVAKALPWEDGADEDDEPNRRIPLDVE
jgi:metacaspase-1